MTNLDKDHYDDEFFEWEDRNDSVPFKNHCIAGSIAGISEHVAMLPFDRIKTRMQIENGNFSLRQAVNTIYQEGKWRGFWKGASIMASGCIPAHAAYFSIYEISKSKFLPKFHDEKQEIYPYIYAMTGALTTMIHDLIITPFDGTFQHFCNNVVLKQRKQLAPEYLNRTSDLIRYMIRTEGPMAFYRSFPIIMLTNIPSASVIVSVNETLKVCYRPEKGHNILTYFFCALIAGGAAAGVTIPLDNIKTKLQTQTFFYDSRKEGDKNLRIDDKRRFIIPQLHRVMARSFITKQYEKIDHPMDAIRYKDIVTTAKLILREHGISGFFRGISPRIISQAPSSAISWSVYEIIKNFLNNNKPLL